MQFLRELLSSSTADGSRTNALNHLQWMVAALLSAFLLCVLSSAPKEITYFLGIVLVLLLICYLITHFYFMVKNPDALRSEKFTIEKMAIERGLVGDSATGMHEPLTNSGRNSISFSGKVDGSS